MAGAGCNLSRLRQLQLPLLLLALLCSAAAVGAKSLPPGLSREAATYLQKFGYLSACGSGGGGGSGSGSGGGSGSSSGCSESETAAAVREFQTSFGLSPSGAVDARTLAAMRRGRCGLADASPRLRRGRRGVRLRPDVALLPPPSVRSQSWRLQRRLDDRRLPAWAQRLLASVAFGHWAAASPVAFRQHGETDFALPDVGVSFVRGRHLNCEHAFEGRGREAAHATNYGEIHVDADEEFPLLPAGEQSLDLVRVLVHEIGHLLRLRHNFSSRSVMHPAAMQHSGSQLLLGVEEREAVRVSLGGCNSSISTMLDWLRSDNRSSGGLVYTSYIFSCNMYWVYNNSAGTPRYGHARNYSIDWSLPSTTRWDAAVQLLSWNSTEGRFDNKVLFFSGSSFYKVNGDDFVPRFGEKLKISDHFGPQPGSVDGISDSIEAAFFDYVSQTLLLFRNEFVYEYSYEQATGGISSCCQRVQQLKSRFPVGDGQPNLPTKLDAVFYSVADSSLYFLSGSQLWRDDAYSATGGWAGASSMRKLNSTVEQRWRHLCLSEACSL